MFYGMPRQETVARWGEESQEGFRFAFKFPRVITHELGLNRSRRETVTFLNLMEPLLERDRLGPLFLQMPPLFSPDQLSDMIHFLDRLPRDFPFGVEVRHRGWFDGETPADTQEAKLNAALKARGIDRVIFDSRPLFSRPPEDETERASQGRKPQVPFRDTVTGQHPMVRLVGRNKVEQVDPWLEMWADTLAAWMRDGLKPFIFLHAPNDLYAPDLARRFHETLKRRQPDLEPLPLWPGEKESREQPQQMSLF